MQMDDQNGFYEYRNRSARGWVYTLESQLDPGRPLSRAKAQVMRDAVAIRPIVAKNTNARMTQTMAVAPPLEFVAW